MLEEVSGFPALPTFCSSSSSSSSSSGSLRSSWKYCISSQLIGIFFSINDMIKIIKKLTDGLIIVAILLLYEIHVHAILERPLGVII